MCEKNSMVDGPSGGHAPLQQVMVRMNKYMSPKTNDMISAMSGGPCALGSYIVMKP